MAKVVYLPVPMALLVSIAALGLIAVPADAQEELANAVEADQPTDAPPAPEPEPQAEQPFVVEGVPEAPAPQADPAFSVESVSEAPAANEFLDMDLSALLDVKIESVSKKAERAFDSPLSATVVTRDEIRRSGARTIMEALRLAPGLIVREQTVGNYDIHIRGLDNVPNSTQLHDFTSTTMLVMVNYRPVYNYYQGGTFWETLPVDVHDVERIEIIRGPAAALYGPNAVTGVINIITRRAEEKGFYTSERVQYGPLWDERIAGASAGYNFGKVSFLLSGHYHHADRHQTSYYNNDSNTWVEDPMDIINPLTGEPLSRPFERYPRIDLATDRFGADLFVTIEPTEKLQIDISGGYQDSRVQKTYSDVWATPLTTNDSQTYYADLRAKAGDFTAHASYLGGEQAPTRGYVVKTTGPDNVREYRLNIFNGELEYDFRFWKNRLSIRPSTSYQRAEYDGVLIAEHRWEDNVIAPGNLITTDSSKALQNIAGSLRGDVLLFERLRIIAGLRLDYYLDRTETRFYERTDSNMDPNTPAVPTTKEGAPLWNSFQLGGTFKLADNQMIRATYGRAHRAPFLVYTYFRDDYQPPPVILGNRALDLLQTDAAEIGYRGKVVDGLEVDAEVFYSYTRNFSEGYPHARTTKNYAPVIYFQFENIDTVAHQAGATASALMTRSRFQGRVFVTAQKTLIEHHAPNIMHLSDYEYDPQDSANQRRVHHKGTPDFFGGFNFNLQPISKLNINANLYVFTRQTQVRTDEVHELGSSSTYEPSVFDVEAKAILNAKISYRFLPGLKGFLSGYNLLFQRSREFFYSDRTNTVAMIGAEYDY